MSDDGFDWDALEKDVAGQVESPDDVVDVTKLTDLEALTRFHEVTEELKTLPGGREILIPRTDRGRELHSLRAALRVTLAERGLL